MVKLKIFETEIESITARDQFLRALGQHLEVPPPMDGFSQYTSQRMFEYDVTLQLGDPDPLSSPCQLKSEFARYQLSSLPVKLIRNL